MSATDFTGQSNAALDERIARARSTEEIRGILKEDLAAKGILVPTQEGYEVNLGIAPQQQRPAPIPVNPAQDRFFRVIYPAGNNRFEISGASEADLDAKEQQIRAMFGPLELHIYLKE